jgi:hypothetical protein
MEYCELWNREVDWKLNAEIYNHGL